MANITAVTALSTTSIQIDFTFERAASTTGNLYFSTSQSVSISPSPGTGTLIYSAPAGTTGTISASYVHQSLTAGQTYYYYVYNNNQTSGTYSGASTIVSGATQQIVPTLTGISYVSANTTWTNAGFTGTFTANAGTMAASSAYDYVVYNQSLTAGSAAALTSAITVTYYSQYVAPNPPPAWSDQTITNTTSKLNVVYLGDAVSATNSPTYAIASGALPTGISLNTSTGAITGTPTAQGSYAFTIRATNAGGSVTTGSLSINVIPPGKRPDTNTALGTAKRFDGTNWIPLTIMKRFDGTNWINISN